jgi:hypothetical protein
VLTVSGARECVLLRWWGFDFLRVALLMNRLALLVGYSGRCIKTHSFVADVAEDWWKGAFGHDWLPICLAKCKATMHWG